MASHTYESGVKSVKENGTNHYVYLNLNDACVNADSIIPPYGEITKATLTIYADSSTASNNAEFKASLTNSNGSTTYLSNFVTGTQDGNGSSITNYTEFTYDATSWFHSKNANAGHINGYGGTGTYIQCYFKLYVLTNYTFASKYKLVFNYNPSYLTLNTSIVGGGTVNGFVSGSVLLYGKTATLTAEPNDGYKFVKWSDGDTNPTKTIVASDYINSYNGTVLNLTAYFEVDKINSILIGTSHPKSIYYTESTKTITFIVDEDVSTTTSGADTVDGYHLAVSKTIPSGSVEITAVLVDKTYIYKKE